MSKYKIAIYLHMYDFQISGLFTKFICLGIKKWNQRKNNVFKKDCANKKSHEICQNTK